jgi:general secretion pathway protein M
MAVAVILVLLYVALWQPAAAYMKRAEVKLQQAQDLLTLIHTNQAVLAASAAPAEGSKPILDSQQLVSSVTNLARQNQLTLKRFEPSGDNKLKVWVDDVPFNNMITWLSQLQEKLGIRVELVTIDKSDQEGRVSARLTLSS